MFIFSQKTKIEVRTSGERKIIILSLLLLTLLVILDQITKAFVVAKIPYHSCEPVIPGFFDISHVTNKGAAWGMFHNSPWFPFSISVIAFFTILVFLRKLTDGWIERYFAMGMILSGILGNSIDRLHYGAVIDFLRFHWRDAAEWPSFNIADSSIVCGVCIFAISTLFRPEKNAEKKVDAPVENSTDTSVQDKDANQLS